LEGGIRNRADLHLAGCLPYLWRSVKYEEVYIKDYQTVPEAVSGLSQYFEFYNHQRLHQALDYQTPAAVHWGKQAVNYIMKEWNGEQASSGLSYGWRPIV